ncbi:hypothetical protein [Methylobacterium soli]|uniref:hypothetical protein n=1 Tax=Methylobacterium soli TaxID=553447 RepID=UPI001EE25548|nr:hypothetical protein [Methylobacterium soli]
MFRNASDDACIVLEECGQALLFAEVLAAHPDLSAAGYRTGETPEAFTALRQALVDRGAHQFDAAAAVLLGAPRRHRMAEGRTSNGLRYIAEHLTGRPVSDGATIAALIACGVPVKRTPGSPHVEIGLSASWLHRQAAMPRGGRPATVISRRE